MKWVYSSNNDDVKTALSLSGIVAIRITFALIDQLKEQAMKCYINNFKDLQGSTHWPACSLSFVKIERMRK